MNKTPVGNCLISKLNREEFEIKLDREIKNEQEKLRFLNACQRFSGSFDEENQKWRFPLIMHSNLVEYIREQLSNVVKLEPIIQDQIKFKFFLYDRHHFAVKFQSISDSLLFLLDKNDIRYTIVDKKDLIFIFNIESYFEMIDNVVFKFSNFDLTPLPNSVIKTFINKDCIQKNKFNITQIQERIHHSIFKNLKEYQKKGVLEAIQRNGRIFLADDIGLGKKIQSLAVADFFFKDWPLIIITTKTAINTWVNQINKWLSVAIKHRFNLPSNDNIDKYIKILDNEKDVEFEENDKIIICNYTLLNNTVDVVLDFPSKFIIVDQSHYIKNKNSQRTKSVWKLTHRCPHVMLLSGTPVLNNLNEIYPQIKAIDRYLFANSSEFYERYKDTNYLNELKLTLLENTVLRRDKQSHDIRPFFPQKKRIIRMVEPNSFELEKKLRNVKQKMKSFLNSNNDSDDQSVNENESKKLDEDNPILKDFFGKTCEVKIKPVCKFIENKMKNTNERFIIVGYHQKMLDALERTIIKKKCKYIKINGKTSREKRESQMENFNKSNEIKVAILSFRTLNSLIFKELYWAIGLILEAEESLLKLGNKNDIKIEYLLANGTADKLIWKSLEDKLNLLRKTGLSKETLPTISFSDEKIQFCENETDSENSLDSSLSGCDSLSSFIICSDKTSENSDLTNWSDISESTDEYDDLDIEDSEGSNKASDDHNQDDEIDDEDNISQDITNDEELNSEEEFIPKVKEKKCMKRSTVNDSGICNATTEDSSSADDDIIFIREFRARSKNQKKQRKIKSEPEESD